jgi:hypothetical protein
MTTRTSSKTVIFDNPFSLKSVDQMVPAGNYRVDTDEELLEGLSFVAYRRVSTVMFLPAKSRRGSSVEMVTIDPLDLQAERDAELRSERCWSVSKPCHLRAW